MIMLSVLTAHWQAAVSLSFDSAGQAPYHRGLVTCSALLRISVTRRRQADYEFHCEFQFCKDPDADPSVSKALRNAHQQGTFAPDAFFRWMASPAMDRFGNLGIGYSFGGTPNFVGQRFAARLASDPPGVLSLHEAVLADGEPAQNAIRWEDYSQTAIDPSDDCTMWYVGDYLRKGAEAYSTRIGSFRLPGCPAARR